MGGMGCCNTRTRLKAWYCFHVTICYRDALMESIQSTRYSPLDAIAQAHLGPTGRHAESENGRVMPGLPSKTAQCRFPDSVTHPPTSASVTQPTPLRCLCLASIQPGPHCCLSVVLYSQPPSLPPSIYSNAQPPPLPLCYTTQAPLRCLTATQPAPPPLPRCYATQPPPPASLLHSRAPTVASLQGLFLSIPPASFPFPPPSLPPSLPSPSSYNLA